MIVPMKHVRLIILKEEKDDILKSLQKGAHVMLIPPQEGESTESVGLETTNADVIQSEAMLKLLDRYSKGPGFFQAKPTVSYKLFEGENLDGQETLKKIEEINDSISLINGRISQLESENQQLRPWTGIGSPLNQLKSSAHVEVIPGFLQPEAPEAVKDFLYQNGCDIQILDTVPEGIAAVLYLYKNDAEELLKQVRELGFTETQVPKTTRPPLEIIRENNSKIDKERENLKSLQQNLEQLGEKRNDLELYIQQEVSKRDRESVPFTSTLQTVTLEGWVRSDRIREFKQNVRSVTDIYELDIRDPNKDETPPTVTKNNYFLAQFETITDSFSLPKAGTLDPAPVAGPWYWIIYGMMMGDAGYGLVMAIVLFLFKKIKKPEGDFGRLVNVLYYSSYTTIFWGIIFGSYFGETFHPILFNPLAAPMYMLIFSLFVGILQLFSGMILKMVLDYKEGHVWDGIFDQLSWIVLITGICFLFVPVLKTLGIIMIALGALTILFTAGRDKPTFIGKVFGGLMGLYNITSYMSDILSYSRILALGLATSVVGMVMNMLAGMVAFNVIGYIFAAIIFIIGHVFNIVLSMLSAYVHDSRLQYIEFFNKFYEGGGLPFKPIQIDQRYIDIIGADISEGSNAVEGYME